MDERTKVMGHSQSLAQAPLIPDLRLLKKHTVLLPFQNTQGDQAPPN